ncbi:UNVERIFIED_CONTAM: protein NRT1/ PTR FAMILY 5.10 [Sesamum angustifolium]|uniref:Protein NRT1/ PTR FAMILY 5.10 n=1 Tax=Sesamum angustifolium TaxID=2727405 RepID=A0AAW2L7J5_9LAMI
MHARRRSIISAVHIAVRLALTERQSSALCSSDRESERERMTISKATGDEISEAEVPLLDDVENGAVDFRAAPPFRSKSRMLESASFILGTGLAERFAYYGISSNLVSFLTKKLGQSTATAAVQLNAWYGISSLFADSGCFRG